MGRLYRVLKRSLTQMRMSEWEKDNNRINWKWRFQEIWEAFTEKVWHNPTDYIYGLYVSIRRVLSWVPILWKDREWDHNFLLKILQFKMKNMRKYHENSKLVADWHKIAKQLKTCEILLERLIENDYCKVEQEDITSTWGRLHFGKNGIYRSKEYSSKDKEDCMKQSLSLYEKQRYLYDQDMDMLLKFIKKYHQKWWD